MGSALFLTRLQVVLNIGNKGHHHFMSRFSRRIDEIDAIELREASLSILNQHSGVVKLSKNEVAHFNNFDFFEPRSSES